MLPRANHIIHRGRQDNKHENCNTPVHIRRRRQWRDGEETKHEPDSQERHGGIIDRGAEFTQGPSPWQERFIAEALETDAADGRHVGEDEGGVGKGNDGVEGDVGAEIQGRDEQGQKQGDEDGVERNVPARSDLGKMLANRYGKLAIGHLTYPM